MLPPNSSAPTRDVGLRLTEGSRRATSLVLSRLIPSAGRGGRAASREQRRNESGQKPDRQCRACQPPDACCRSWARVRRTRQHRLPEAGRTRALEPELAIKRPYTGKQNEGQSNPAPCPVRLFEEARRMKSAVADAIRKCTASAGRMRLARFAAIMPGKWMVSRNADGERRRSRSPHGYHIGRRFARQRAPHCQNHGRNDCRTDRVRSIERLLGRIVASARALRRIVVAPRRGGTG